MIVQASYFDSHTLLAFMASAYVKRDGNVTTYIGERRLIENAMIEPPDGLWKRASDRTPNG